MSGNEREPLVPKLRFPEFRGAVSVLPLDAVADFVSEKTSVDKLIPAQYVSTENLLPDFGGISPATKLPSVSSVTSFRHRDILVSNIRPYLKKVWQSDMCGGVSNDVLVIRPTERVGADYLAAILRSDFFIDYVMRGAKGVKMPRGEIAMIREFPVPNPCPEEQKKIADCLSSLDDLIAAENQKLEKLQTHRAVLMQQILPREREATPRLRFPEFRKRSPWKNKTLSEIATIRSGSTPSRAEPAFYSGGTIPWVKTTDLNNGFIVRTEEYVTSAAKVKVNPVGSVLVAMYGGFKQIGRTGYLTMPAATNQAISVLNADENEVLPIYLLTWMNARVGDWKRIASSSRKDPNITGTDVANFPIAYPDKDEQQKISDTVTSVNRGIEAQIQKITFLTAHKTGLLQQLFPAMDEVPA